MLYTFKFHVDGHDMTRQQVLPSDMEARKFAMRLATELLRTVKIVGDGTIGVAMQTAWGPIFLDANRIQDAPAMRDLKRWDGLPLVLATVS